MNNASSETIQRSPEVQLSELTRVVRASFGQLYEHPALAWITPRPAVRLRQAGGGESLWAGSARVEASEAQLRSAPFIALELPAELVLSRQLVLPLLSASDLRDAIALDVRDSSPFEPSDLVWGYRTAPAAESGQVAVTAVLASRRRVTQHIQEVAPELADPEALEVWVMADDGAPVVIQGFGERARARSAGRGRLLAYALMVAGLMLGVAIAVTPTVQLRLRTLQAVAAYQALQQRAGPAIAQREALVRGREDLANLREVMSDHVDPMVALDMLTQLVPDDTWLQRVQAQGTRFTLTGQTPNAAALMNTLSRHPGLKDVRAPSAATRAYGTNREAFVVEFTVAPELLQRAQAGAAMAPPAVTAVASVAAPAAAAASTPAPVRSMP